MPLICYAKRTFSAGSLLIIERANEIISTYQDQGLDLTLRQVYYQFVSRDWLPNKQSEYKRLGSILNDARLAGLIDWLAIEDRTRNLRSNSHWDGPAALLKTAASAYGEDLWATQDFYVEVWIEKDALVGVLDAVCPKLDVPFFSCRGYTSQSEMWSAAWRINKACRVNNRNAVIIHLGDHDPSGVDMTRDIADRLNTFSNISFKKPPSFDKEWVGAPIEIRRIALTRDQITQYDPPPNPAKMTDARATAYVAKHGDSSWELDALEPRTLIDLITSEIESLRDAPAWNKALAAQEKNRKRILTAASKLE